MPEMPDFDQIMKMAQNAQAELQKAQESLDKIEVEGHSGGGLVKIRATAKGRILSVSIDDSLIVPEDKQVLEDLVTAAFNDARGKADQAANAGATVAASTIRSSVRSWRSQSASCAISSSSLILTLSPSSPSSMSRRPSRVVTRSLTRPTSWPHASRTRA